MKNIFILFVVVFFLGCSKESPIAGIYQTKDARLSANVLDSTIYLIIGIDTAIIYDIKIHSVHHLDSITYRVYNVLYNNSLNRNGFESFDIPLKFDYSPTHGGALTASFINDDSFMLGGYVFLRQRGEEEKKIFDSWIDLFTDNIQTRLWRNQKGN